MNFWGKLPNDTFHHSEYRSNFNYTIINDDTKVQYFYAVIT